MNGVCGVLVKTVPVIHHRLKAGIDVWDYRDPYRTSLGYWTPTHRPSTRAATTSPGKITGTIQNKTKKIWRKKVLYAHRTAGQKFCRQSVIIVDCQNDNNANACKFM
ncbi:hypothetical protein BaRGS_00001312 [Batillaria attramentaria]|uniref:Uncharacterized protein n=1 Tax=Batillaria attramentaria TaxID=370345 RepID=A0ABD0M6U3_9CAEN